MRHVGEIVFVLLMLLGAVAIAAGAEDGKPLTSEQRLRFENLALRRQLLAREAEKLTEEQNALVQAVCSGAGIEVKDCRINPESGTITKAEPKKEEAKK